MICGQKCRTAISHPRLPDRLARPLDKRFPYALVFTRHSNPNYRCICSADSDSLQQAKGVVPHAPSWTAVAWELVAVKSAILLPARGNPNAQLRGLQPDSGRENRPPGQTPQGVALGAFVDRSALSGGCERPASPG